MASTMLLMLNNLNKALEAAPDLSEMSMGQLQQIQDVRKELGLQYGIMAVDMQTTLFWQVIAPGGSKTPHAKACPTTGIIWFTGCI